MNVKVVALPSGFDPDLYVRTYGIERFNTLIFESKNLFDYKLSILKSMYDKRNPEGKLRIATEMLATIKKFPHPVSRATYIKILSEQLQIEEEILFLELKKIKDYNYPLKSHLISKSENKIDIHPTERLLIRLMLQEEQTIKKLMEVISPDDFQNEKTSQIVSVLFDLVSKGKNIMVNNLLNYFSQEEIMPILCELSFSPPIDEEEKEKIIQDCIQRLKERKIKIQRENLHKQIKLAQSMGDTERLRLLMKEFCKLSRSTIKKEEVI
jgi:DNA primase